VLDQAATPRPGMADPGGWQPARDDPAHPHPRDRGLMASARQCASPVPCDDVVERWPECGFV